MARAILIMAALNMESSRNMYSMSRNEIRSESSATSIKRKLRDHAHALELSDEEFEARYRLTKELFLKLCSELRPYIARSKRSTKISLECKVLTALSFYATGSGQKPVGKSYLHSLSQPSVSKAVKEVTTALNNHEILRKYIHFPHTQQGRQKIIAGFATKFGFPNCLGCIDGTHVALIKPKNTLHKERFFNSKLYSRNVQIICDSDLNILNIDATFGGATNDAYIWSYCELSEHLEELHKRGQKVWLLGDSGYPLSPWLLTPIENAEPCSAEDHYNKLHTQTRNTVEHCITVLKARWRCLLANKGLHYDHHTVANIINACAVLHNFCNRHRVPLPDLSSIDVQDDQKNQIPQPPMEDSDACEFEELVNGQQQRSRIVQRLWAEIPETVIEK